MGTVSDQDMHATLSASFARIKEGSFEAAETLLSPAIAAGTRHPVALYLMGMSYFGRARWDEAEDFLRRALAIAPAQPDINLHLARCLRALQRPAESLEYFRMVLKAQPQHSGAWTELAEAEAESGATAGAEATHEQAEAAYRQILARTPDHPQTILNYSQFLNSTGRAPEAEALLRRALAMELPSYG